RLYFDDTWGAAQDDSAGFGYRWAMTGNALLRLPLDDAPVTLTFRLLGAHPNQTVHLRVNSGEVAQWTLTEQWADYQATIPPSALQDGLDELAFVTDTTS